MRIRFENIRHSLHSCDNLLFPVNQRVSFRLRLASWLFGLLFDPEDGGNTFHRNTTTQRGSLANNVVTYPMK
jgi:hypothetical protein